MIDRGFWRGRRVLVTGHTGFKGAWLALWLHELGARVVGFGGPPPSDPSLFALARVGELVDDVRGDVRDVYAVAAAVERARPDVVLHLAAQALVRRSYEDPAGTWETNVTGTLHVLEAVRAHAPEAAVVVVTSDKCYRNDGAGRAFREDDPLGGRDPYSASKAAQELVAASHRDAYGLRIATARAGNVIGGGDWGADRLVPDVFRAAAAGSPLVLRNPDATRPWQHVLSPLSGYLRLAERVAESASWARGWNFGPAEEDARPVSEVVAALGAGVDVRVEPSPLAEAPALRLDSTLARERLGWAPVGGLEAAVEATARWHREVAAGADPREVTLRELRATG